MMTVLEFMCNVLLPVGVGAALGFPAGWFAGIRASRRKAL